MMPLKKTTALITAIAYLITPTFSPLNGMAPHFIPPPKQSSVPTYDPSYEPPTTNSDNRNYQAASCPTCPNQNPNSGSIYYPNGQIDQDPNGTGYYIYQPEHGYDPKNGPIYDPYQEGTSDDIGGGNGGYGEETIPEEANFDVGSGYGYVESYVSANYCCLKALGVLFVIGIIAWAVMALKESSSNHSHL